MRSDSADTRGACPHKQTLFLFLLLSLHLLSLLSLSPHLGKAAGVADRKGFSSKAPAKTMENGGEERTVTRAARRPPSTPGSTQAGGSTFGLCAAHAPLLSDG